MFFDTYTFFLLSYYAELFFPPSVLKILGELNSSLPSKVVEDFSMATHRNNSVSVTLHSLQTQFTLIINQPHVEYVSHVLCHIGESVLVWLKCNVSAFLPLQPTSQVTVTSSGRTVKRRFHQLDDDPDQEVLE